MAKSVYLGLSESALDVCIRRMAKTLASKPRNKKTRGYVFSLNDREQKTASQVEKELREFAKQEKHKAAREIACRVIERAEVGDVPTIRRARKQRISPMAAKSERRHLIKRCRRASRYQPKLSGSKSRKARDMNEMRALRETLFAAQDGVCGICGSALDANPAKGSLDHVIPHSAIPREHGNYVLTHGECNGDKSNDIPTGCEMVFLLAVNCKIGATPQTF